MVDACLEKMQANPEENEAIAEQQEVPKEETTVKTTRALGD
jgi:hypothetical protein